MGTQTLTLGEFTSQPPGMPYRLLLEAPQGSVNVESFGLSGGTSFSRLARELSSRNLGHLNKDEVFLLSKQHPQLCSGHVAMLGDGVTALLLHGDSCLPSEWHDTSGAEELVFFGAGHRFVGRVLA